MMNVESRVALESNVINSFDDLPNKVVVNINGKPRIFAQKSEDGYQSSYRRESKYLSKDLYAIRIIQISHTQIVLSSYNIDDALTYPIDPYDFNKIFVQIATDAFKEKIKVDKMLKMLDKNYVATSRTALEAPKSWKRFYFVFELKSKFKDYRTWFKFFKKNLENVQLSSGGMLTDRVAVLIGDVPIFVETLEPDQYGNKTTYTDEEHKRIRKSIESIRDYIVRQDVVERGIAIDESSYGFGSLIREYIKDKLDPDRRTNVFNRIEENYKWELPLWLRR
jgi:hypothetical protein